LILAAFAMIEPCKLKESVHPLSPLQDGVPSVRVFEM
jgi:hypothetical protein